MKVMYFTNRDITDWDVIPNIIKKYGDKVYTYTEKPTLELIKEEKIDFIVSDRARSLITEDIIAYLPKKIINLHPSFLPWNRGYHPNYWSIKENTPHGVTIHYIDKDIDTGDILIQIKLGYSNHDTLRTTYDKLRKYMVLLFESSWCDIKDGRMPAVQQNIFEGTLHYNADFNGVLENLELGWDTKIKDI
jgi:methionyl-tRNA formyltransferase